MTTERIGINYTSINNLTVPDFNLPTSGADFINHIPNVANAASQGYLGYFIMGLMAIISYYVLSDDSAFADFRFNKLRGLSISLGVASIFGIVQIMIGYITNYVAVGFFLGLFIASQFYLAMVENKE